MIAEVTVKEVSVFRSGCSLKAEGSAEFAEGASVLRIHGLTAEADASSVRVLLPENVQGSNVQVRWPQDDELSPELEELIQKLDSLAARISACEVQEQIWKGNTVLSASQNFDLSMMKDYTEELPAQLSRIAEEKRRLNKERTELQKKQTELAAKENCPYIELNVQCSAAGTYPLAVEYFDPQASWNPSYEIRAEQEDEPLTVRLRANIRQNTGTDWQDVSLSLFTGNPSVSAQIPHMDPVHVAFEAPKPQPRMFAKTMRMSNFAAGATMEAAAMDDTMEMNLMEVAEETAVREEGETMSEYRLNGTWTICSDEADEHADLSVSKIPCTYHVVSLPGLSNSAYLAAEIKTEDLQDILDCSASLYLNGTYSGDVRISADLSKPTYDLSLGIDETVKITRTRKKKYSSSVLLKGQRKTDYEYEIEALSKKNRTCRVTVTDQIPVSEEKTIIVERGNLSGGTFEEETGNVTWNFELSPQEKKTLTLAYSVAWPKDRQITEKKVRVSRGYCPECGAPLSGGKFCDSCGYQVH